MTTKNIYDNFKKSSAYGEQGKGTSFDFITEIKNTYPEAKTIILKSVSISVGAVLNALKLQYKVDEHTLEFCYPPDQKTWQHELIINSQIIEVDFNYGTISSNGNSIGNITFYLDDGKESTYVPASDGNKCSISLGGNPIIGFFGTYDKAPFGNRLCSIGVYFDLTSLERLLKVIPDNAADSSGDTKIKYAKTILDAGYDSAQRISEDSESNFLNKLKDKDILESDLKSIYQNAQNVNHWLENLRASYILPTSDSPSPANTNPNDSSKDAFNEEISYTTLFKDTQFCDCEQCLSNQSPAAFFTSLMEITEKYAKTKTEQKLGLNDRRPDLWTLPLTCDNTIIEQPYLQLVNKTLTGYLSSKSINWQTIASGASRFIPYNQSNAHIRTVFNSIDTSFSQVTEYFTKDRKNSLAWIYETIGITQSDVDVIVSNTTNLNKDIVPKSFREATGMSVNELELLVYQNLSDKEINAGFLTRLFINLKNGNTPLKYYKKTSTEPERFENLSADNLFQIRAFLLLATRLCWTYPELNHVLKALNITDFLPTEGDKPLEKVNAALNNLAQVSLLL